jgi:DNA polymerase V
MTRKSLNPNGRPRGTGKYGEVTQTVRVPVSMVEEVVDYAASRGHRLRLYENRVSAGTLTPTDDDVKETIQLHDMLVKHPKDTLCVRVQGESMTGVGIMPDDILIVDSREIARDGKIVVAAVNADVTVKRLSKNREGVWLKPENPKYEPIPVGPDDNMVIWGVVTGVVRTKT